MGTTSDPYVTHCKQQQKSNGAYVEHKHYGGVDRVRVVVGVSQSGFM